MCFVYIVINNKEESKPNQQKIKQKPSVVMLYLLNFGYMALVAT